MADYYVSSFCVRRTRRRINSKLIIGHVTLARRVIKQNFEPSASVLALMEIFRQLTNDCIRTHFVRDRTLC